MGNIYRVWQSFWQNQGEFKIAISQNAKRATLSEEAALILVAIFEFNGLKAECAEYILNELKEKGLILFEGEIYKTTAKGAILAKSFLETLKKY